MSVTYPKCDWRLPSTIFQTASGHQGSSLTVSPLMNIDALYVRRCLFIFFLVTMNVFKKILPTTPGTSNVPSSTGAPRRFPSPSAPAEKHTVDDYVLVKTLGTGMKRF